MTLGHNIVADVWAGAANPIHTQHPLPTQTHTQKASNTLVLPLFNSCPRMDQRTNGPTDKASYRVAYPTLNRRKESKKIKDDFFQTFIIENKVHLF